MDQREDVLLAADRLFFPRFCDLWPRRDPHPGYRPGSRDREPAFCVLPDGAAPAPKAEPVDGGMW